MSVIKSKRSTSRLEFLATARKLELYTIRQCTKFPKRYTIYLGQPIVALSVDIYNHVKAANSIFPSNREEAQKRRNHFIEAKGSLSALTGQVEIVEELQLGLKMERLSEWAELIDIEGKLINAIMKSDKQRAKTLTE